MTNFYDLLEWQQDQYQHDMRNHFDILSLHKHDRLKHYAMHFAKYAGRIARGTSERKTEAETITDAALVSLSAANTMSQRLERNAQASNLSFLLRLTDAAGRFNDAAEKIDHLEPFLDQAKESNQDLMDCLLDRSETLALDVKAMLAERRKFLREKQFFIRS